MLIEPFWEKTNKYLSDLWIAGIPDDFMQEPTFHGTVHASNEFLVLELPTLIDHMPNALFSKLLLHEPEYGSPSLVNGLSPTTVHQLYHLVRYQKATHKNLFAADHIVEWGGGWGNLARLMLIANPKMRYTIIDTPLYSRIQRQYFEHVMPDASVEFIDIENLSDQTTGDTFISTWALSESTPAAVDYVVDRNYFGAENILLAYDPGQEPFTNPAYLETRLDDFKFRQPIPERSRYAFK